mmetsp:Transcript_23245/g.72652  ORF Transcript_23245/g.72652 Transcript_23245/m.72652 type:complete len:437 (+) Transcript_23245:1030-2340(+)
MRGGQEQPQRGPEPVLLRERRLLAKDAGRERANRDLRGRARAGLRDPRRGRRRPPLRHLPVPVPLRRLGRRDEPPAQPQEAPAPPREEAGGGPGRGRDGVHLRAPRVPLLHAAQVPGHPRHQKPRHDLAAPARAGGRSGSRRDRDGAGARAPRPHDVPGRRAGVARGLLRCGAHPEDPGDEDCHPRQPALREAAGLQALHAPPGRGRAHQPGRAADGARCRRRLHALLPRVPHRLRRLHVQRRGHSLARELRRRGDLDGDPAHAAEDPGHQRRAPVPRAAGRQHRAGDDPHAALQRRGHLRAAAHGPGPGPQPAAGRAVPEGHAEGAAQERAPQDIQLRIRREAEGRGRVRRLPVLFRGRRGFPARRRNGGCLRGRGEPPVARRRASSALVEVAGKLWLPQWPADAGWGRGRGYADAATVSQVVFLRKGRDSGRGR